MAYAMTHVGIAEALASEMMDILLLENQLQLQRAYDSLCRQYEDYTEVELLEAIREFKEELEMGQAYRVDDLLSAAEKNVELYSKSIAKG